jgi:hypothetical protein
MNNATNTDNLDNLPEWLQRKIWCEVEDLVESVGELGTRAVRDLVPTSVFQAHDLYHANNLLDGRPVPEGATRASIVLAMQEALTAVREDRLRGSIP